MDAIERYLKVYDKVKLIKGMLSAANHELAAEKIEILSHLSNLQIDSAGRDGRTLSKSIRVYGKVTNYDLLRDYVLELDAPQSEYMQEEFIKGSPKNPRGIFLLIEDAKEAAISQGRSMKDCLPPGLELTMQTIVTVRTTRKEIGLEEFGALTAKGKLEEVFKE